MFVFTLRHSMGCRRMGKLHTKGSESMTAGGISVAIFRNDSAEEMLSRQREHEN